MLRRMAGGAPSAGQCVSISAPAPASVPGALWPLPPVSVSVTVSASASLSSSSSSLPWEEAPPAAAEARYEARAAEACPGCNDEKRREVWLERRAFEIGRVFRVFAFVAFGAFGAFRDRESEPDLLV